MYKVIVASIPRTGSTLTARAFARLLALPSWNQQDSSRVYKTHLLEPEVNVKCKKAIFLFGDMQDSVMSMLHRRWDLNSFRNCGWKGQAEEVNIITRDDLRFEQLFDTWTNPTKYTVCAVRYETLQHYTNFLNDFVGYKGKWPIFRQRKKYDCSKKLLYKLTKLTGN